MKTWLKTNWQLITFCIIGIVVRFWNFQEAMYFIYDVGRDVIILREMSQGDMKLVGSTTGLPGVFLGPLWLYVGVVGYVLTQGNPYGVQLWYIAVASLALPLYWILAKRLFGKTMWAVLAAVLLAFLPGGITGTNFVWNPMLSVPLMTGALLCLIRARESQTFVYLGFFLLALTVQSEFAYAIFFITFGFLAIPWLRGKFEWKTLILTAAVIGLTLIPQLLFEVTHGFSMSKSLLSGMNQSGTTVPQSYLWAHRPTQLWQATVPFFIKNDFARSLALYCLVFFWLMAVAAVVIKRTFEWKLILLVALLPYCCYMFWKGNYGFFFEYYITPHFIPLVLLMVFGMQQLVHFFGRLRLSIVAIIAAIGLTYLLLYQGYVHLNGIILRPQNNAGLKVMMTAVERLYMWSHTDGAQQTVFRIYTPNLHTENYDYLVWWMSQKNDWRHPSTVQQPGDTARYILYEPDVQNQKDRFLPWYTQATQGMTLTRQEKIGVLTAETWHK